MQTLYQMLQSLHFIICIVKNRAKMTCSNVNYSTKCFNAVEWLHKLNIKTKTLKFNYTLVSPLFKTVMNFIHMKNVNSSDSLVNFHSWLYILLCTAQLYLNYTTSYSKGIKSLRTSGSQNFHKVCTIDHYRKIFATYIIL